MHSFAFENRFTKTQLVEQICAVNTSAPREWLESFDFAALERYLGRLRTARLREAFLQEHADALAQPA